MFAVTSNPMKPVLAFTVCAATRSTSSKTFLDEVEPAGPNRWDLARPMPELAPKVETRSILRSVNVTSSGLVALSSLARKENFSWFGVLLTCQANSRNGVGPELRGIVHM